jgi:hypothetical protein
MGTIAEARVCNTTQPEKNPVMKCSILIHKFSIAILSAFQNHVTKDCKKTSDNHFIVFW